MKQKMTHRKFCKSADDAIAELKRLYAEQMCLMETRFAAFTNDDFDSIDSTHPVYPMISLKVPSEFSSETSNLSLGDISRKPRPILRNLESWIGRNAWRGMNILRQSIS